MTVTLFSVCLFFYSIELFLITDILQLQMAFHIKCLAYCYIKIAFCFPFKTVTNNKGQISLQRVLVIRPTADTISYYSNILREIRRDNASSNEIRIFEFEHVRYIFNNHIDQFVRLRQLDEISSINQLIIYSNYNSVSDEQREAT